MTTHGKTFAVVASFNNECLWLLDYSSNNICNWVKNHKNYENFPFECFAVAIYGNC